LIGAISSANSIGYATGKLVAGLIAERVGPRAVFAGGLLGAAAANAAFTFMEHPLALQAAWLLNGVAQGCGWPAIAVLLRTLFRADQVASYWSVLSASGNVASAVAPTAVSLVIAVSGGSWRAPFLLAAAGATAMSLLFLGATAGLVPPPQQQQRGAAAGSPEQASWGALGRERLFWVVSAAYAVTYFVKNALADWTQMYLMQTVSLTVLEAGAALGSFEMGGVVGSLIIGVVSDRMVARFPHAPHGAPRFPALTVSAALTALGILMLLSIPPVCLPAVCCSYCCWLIFFFFARMQGQGVMAVHVVLFVLGMAIYASCCLYGVLAIETVPPLLANRATAMTGLLSQGKGKRKEKEKKKKV
jgi:OPA family glycerol-6-phosphate transporter-like MFS transporter 4